MVFKICVVGPKQSGSTRLYNLLILLYKNQNTYWCAKYMHDKDDKYNIIISKIHFKPYPKYLKSFDIVILPIRDVRDSGISACARWGKDIKNISIKKYFYKRVYKNIRLVNSVLNYTNYIFFYEKYNLKYIRKLIKYLKLKKTKQECVDIMIKLDELHNLKDLKLSKKEADIIYNKTLCSAEHNSSGGKSKKYLTYFSFKENINILKDERIYDFLKKFKYPIEFEIN